jgi:hypothetical protein
MPLREPFPSLPPLSVDEYAALNREQRWRRFIVEIEAAQKQFDAAQELGVDIFEAAELVPTARANRKGARQSDIRALYRSPAEYRAGGGQHTIGLDR